MSAKSVESITVGTFGDVDATAVPFGTQVNDSWAEHLYTAQEIGKACTIERISFAHKSGNPITTKEIKIYLTETTKTDYADKSWTAEEDLVLVYSDTDIIIGEQEWETFELDTPFEYSGEKNLAVVVAKSSDETSGLLFWYCDEIANSVLVTSETSEYPTATTQSASYNKRPAIRFSWVTGDAPEPTKPAAPVVSAEAISDVAVRLSWASEEARQRQKERYGENSLIFNSHLSSSQVKKYCALGKKEQGMMEEIFKKYDMSTRAYQRILKVARTIADLAGEEQISTTHLSEAFFYRSLDKKYWR